MILFSMHNVGERDLGLLTSSSSWIQMVDLDLTELRSWKTEKVFELSKKVDKLWKKWWISYGSKSEVWMFDGCSLSIMHLIFDYGYQIDVPRWLESDETHSRIYEITSSHSNLTKSIKYPKQRKKGMHFLRQNRRTNRENEKSSAKSTKPGGKMKRNLEMGLGNWMRSSCASECELSPKLPRSF